MSRIEAGRTHLVIASFSLRSMISEILESFEILAREKNIELTTLVDQSVPEFLFSDSMRLRKIVVHLVANSLKFTERGHVRVEVKMANGHSLKASNRYVQIMVMDTGMGIDPKDQSKLFQTFGQLDTTVTRKYRGTGLGLSLSRKIAESLGGTL